MNVHIGYRLHKTPAVEKDIQHQIERLGKRLQVFRPELIHLKGSVEEAAGDEGIGVSLNLRLPSGQMAVKAKAPLLASAIKIAFDDLLHQVSKHKDLLRSTHKWPRRGNEASTHRGISVPFEQTLAVVFPATVSSDDVRSYVNANLSRLERFVEREIYLREATGLVLPNSICKEEVIDEAIAAALADGDVEASGQMKDGYEKPERLALEPWLYRLAKRALDELSRPEGSNSGAVRLEESARQQNVKASDEPELQFHQPDESITEETIIADQRSASPEQIVGSDEMMRLIASALRDVIPAHREAFILHAIEGFSIDEISAITGDSTKRVTKAISAARDHLRQSPSFGREFKERMPGAGSGKTRLAARRTA